MTPTLELFEEAACAAARKAGALLRERFLDPAGQPAEVKGLHDFVTAADRDAEAIVLGLLRERFPEHAILSEEAAPDAPRAAHRWIVDPLDGTTNFIHRVPTFAVSIALEDPQGLAVGAIYDPMRDELFHARRGGGAWLGNQPVRSSERRLMGEALIATGFPFRELSRLSPYLRSFESFVRTTAGIRRAGSASIDLAYTACGRYDGFWELGLSRWDIAAGALLVREAGGAVTDLAGGEAFLETGDILAGGSDIHSAMLAVTRECFGG